MFREVQFGWWGAAPEDGEGCGAEDAAATVLHAVARSGRGARLERSLRGGCVAAKRRICVSSSRARS